MNMEHNESSSFQQPRQTTDGSTTSEPRSEKSSGKYRGGHFKMSMKEQREAARLYKEKAGTAAEIAKMYGVHYSTIFAALDRFGVPRHNPKASVAVSEAMRRRWAEQRAKETKLNTEQAVYSPDLRDQYLVAEPPSPTSTGVDIDAVHLKPKRRSPRKKKGWWQRLKERFFGR